MNAGSPLTRIVIPFLKSLIPELAIGTRAGNSGRGLAAAAARMAGLLSGTGGMATEQTANDTCSLPCPAARPARRGRPPRTRRLEAPLARGRADRKSVV